MSAFGQFLPFAALHRFGGGGGQSGRARRALETAFLTLHTVRVLVFK